ncbi:MAG TPA: right-handed parallel beta-helix repeat-containing protein [Thermoanaerobaculia bacterium]|nr:right-handed parallel beta-helix repeat-containing protein [Thermoanaerobaculia bacterium]
MRLWKVAVVMMSFALLAVEANAATYYVSTSGNDANNGALSTPFRTISHGAGVAQAGDTVYVRAGVYNDLVRISSKGTAAAHVHIANYPGEAPVIDGTGTAASTDLVVFSSAQYVDFSGFEVRNSTHIGICVYPGSFLTISGNNVHGSVRNGIWAGYSSFGTTSDLTISGNTVWNNVLENQNRTMSGGWAQAIGTENANRVTISGNKIYQNYGEGIAYVLSDGGTVKNNTVYDNYSVEIYLDNAQTTTVDSNLTYTTGNSAYYRSGYPASGIGTANESYSTSNPLNGLTIVNNIVLNSKYGFYYSNEANGGGLQNVTVANNTFYKGAVDLIWIASAAHSGSVVENNVFYQVGNVMTNVAGSGVAYRNNDWYGGTAGTASGSGDVLADPRLANAGGLTAADYKLTFGSPAVAVGLSLSNVTLDYFGAARVVAYDLGAHQLGSTSNADTTAPSVPASLTATAATSSVMTLAWLPSTDNTGVTGYQLYRNGTLIGTTGSLTFSDSGLAAGTQYSYTVKAYDAAGNVSAASNTATTSTLPSGVMTGGADTIAPTMPASLTATATSSSTVSLAWGASTDNVAVTGYRILRNGAYLTTVTSTSFNDSGLAESTTYTYSVSALDSAGNQSSVAGAAVKTLSAKKHRASAH